MGGGIMRSAMKASGASVIFLGVTSAIGMPPARAQMAMTGGGRSLGGYDASTISSYYGAGPGDYIPYNGRASAFIPYSGGGGRPGVQPIPRRLSRSSICGSIIS